MPPVGRLLSGVDFSQLFIGLTPEARSLETVAALTEAGEPAILYGQFINDVISFVILGFVVFMFVRQYNKMKAPAPAAGPSELDVLMEIRDGLKK
jgi:large conductance mechanosensitive channel